MNGLIIPYNVNKYTQSFVRREGMHFVMSLNYCWYIIFVHFHWGWLRLSEFCLFIFMVLGSLTIKILVNQVLFHPTSPWDVGLRRSDHFTPCFYFCCLEQCKTRTWYCDFCHAFCLIGEFPIDQMKQSDWSEQIACRFQDIIILNVIKSTWSVIHLSAYSYADMYTQWPVQVINARYLPPVKHDTYHQ